MMNAEIHDLFPLTVFKDKIVISKKEKNIIIDFIFNSEKESKNIKKRIGDAWLGDTKGYEYLFKDLIMKNLVRFVRAFFDYPACYLPQTSITLIC